MERYIKSEYPDIIAHLHTSVTARRSGSQSLYRSMISCLEAVDIEGPINGFPRLSGMVSKKMMLTIVGEIWYEMTC